MLLLGCPSLSRLPNGGQPFLPIDVTEISAGSEDQRQNGSSAGGSRVKWKKASVEPGRTDGAPIGKRPMEVKAEEPFFLKLGLAMQRRFSESSSLYVPSAGVRGHYTWSKVIFV